MSDDAKPPDYTTMSGAEFQRAVGTDPEKWAEAFDQAAGQRSAETGGRWPRDREERVEFLAKWFQDAMHAAVAAHPTVVVPPGHWASWDAPESEKE